MCLSLRAHLHKLGRYDITRALALAVTAAILFVIANAKPMVVLEVQGNALPLRCFARCENCGAKTSNSWRRWFHHRNRRAGDADRRDAACAGAAAAG